MTPAVRAATPAVSAIATTIAVTAALAGTGCSGPGSTPADAVREAAVSGAPSTQPSGPLAGTSWRLVEFQSMDDAQGTTRPVDPSLYTMQLDADGTVAMRLNCNRATGAWTAEPSADPSNGRFEFGPLATTRALCPPPSMDELIAAQTQYVRGYMLRDGRLHLSLMADGGIFVWEPRAEAPGDIATNTPPTEPRTALPPAALPPTAVRLIRERYSSPDLPPTRYLSGRVDLDGDDRPELLVHLVGPMPCGTGGCPTLVFTADERGAVRLVSVITVSRPPIRVSPRRTRGWLNLIVEVAGGGGRSGHAEIEYDGQGYAENPTVPPARRITDLAGTEVVIDDFDSFDAAAPLPPQ